MSNQPSMKALTLAAIGVVFGDIGTSPLYTMREVFAGSHRLALTQESVIAILSLIFWSLIIVVSIKYVSVVMRANNNGEGGIMALMQLALRTTAANPSRRKFLVSLGLFGAALFFADGVITPAISVLSAVEGIQLMAPALRSHIIPLTIGVLFGLFWMQKKGTGSIGALFGPVMCVWFGVLAILGLTNIYAEPSVLAALNPWHALGFIAQDPKAAFFSLGGAVLALTGVEALYADMGHLGRAPIQRAWYWLVFPALTLNYFGQGALLIADANAIVNPFYMLAPSWALFPLIVLATCATVIASQAVISGAFSIAKQVMQLGYSPRLDMAHTSEHEMGQVYLPFINWTLFALIVLLVVNFKTSTSLGAAYGLAATGTMVITTCMSFIVIKDWWKWHHAIVALVIPLFMIVDFSYFAANIIKIEEGGWIPLLIGLLIYTLMKTWNRGRMLHLKKNADDDMELDSFIRNIEKSEVYRPDGMAVYLTANGSRVPHSLLHNLYHNKVLHQTVLLVTVKTKDVPHVPESEQITVEHLRHGFHRVMVNYGFKDDPNVPRALELSKSKGIPYEAMRTSYFLGRDNLVAKVNAGFCSWRERLYIWMYRNSSGAPSYFRLPLNRVIELGTQRAL